MNDTDNFVDLDVSALFDIEWEQCSHDAEAVGIHTDRIDCYS